MADQNPETNTSQGQILRPTFADVLTDGNINTADVDSRLRLGTRYLLQLAVQHSDPIVKFGVSPEATNLVETNREKLSDKEERELFSYEMIGEKTFKLIEQDERIAKAEKLLDEVRRGNSTIISLEEAVRVNRVVEWQVLFEGVKKALNKEVAA